MIRYYNGQVALSTLTITLSERDIHTPATAVETETADVGIEADDVEKARDSALKAIDDALKELAEVDPDGAKVVELRFFGGYRDQEVMEALGVSQATVRRDWEFARAWLYDKLAVS